MKNLVKMIVLYAVITLSGSCFAQCSARCQAAFDFVVSHEDRSLSGTISHEPFGGVARFGVNSHAHPKAVRDGFYRMPRKKALVYAQNLFYIGYWKTIRGDEIQDRKLAFRMADLAYNLGPVRAIILLQRALNDQGAYLITKGYFGEDTMFYVNVYSYERTQYQLKKQAKGFYLRLAAKYPVMRTWKGVWLDRLAENEDSGVPMPDVIVNILSAPHPLPELADPGFLKLSWEIQ